MNEAKFLKDYVFDWEIFDLIMGGKSVLDAASFLGPIKGAENVYQFLEKYGLDQENPVMKAELFGHFQEALQFIRRYFLEEEVFTEYNLKIPFSIIEVSDVVQLFLKASGRPKYTKNREEAIWAGIVLKIMHTIIHADKDLRHHYFPIIQQQIFDKFYKHLSRDENNKLMLGGKGESNENIELIDFEIKAQKGRDSIILKMLHKAENVAEELFDRIGIRFIVRNKIEILRVLHYLHEHNIIVPHNVKPSRSVNTLIDLELFKNEYPRIIAECKGKGLTEKEFIEMVEALMAPKESTGESGDRNQHSSRRYRSVQFTCRQLISYKNPFFSKFKEVRNYAKSIEDFGNKDANELAKRLIDLDASPMMGTIRFYYPFEVQIVDMDSHHENTVGDSSHNEYKIGQLKTCFHRLFDDLISLREKKRKMS